MSQTLTDKAAAERERKAKIRQGKERLAALDDVSQRRVQQKAAYLETHDTGKKAAWRYLEQALDIHDAEQAPDAEATIDLDDPASVAAGVDELAEGMLESLRIKVVAARVEDKMTLAEIQQKFNLHPNLVRELLGAELAASGGAKKAARSRKAAREVRGDGATRQEKCPDCGEFRAAQKHDDGKYDAGADFREGRSDCRACYNRRWREGQARRKAAK
jgi:hypothetical protein